jgi:hypothetical protein
MKNLSTLLFIALASVAVCTASSAVANGLQPASDRANTAAGDTAAWLPPGVTATDLLFHAPGERSAGVLTVFRLHVTDVIQLPWRSLRKRLRPYLLGGSTMVRLPTGEGLIPIADQYEESTTLHVGAGTELLLGRRLWLSVDMGEVIHGGALSEQSHERYNLGLNWSF